MGKRIFVLLVIAWTTLWYGCSNGGEKQVVESNPVKNTVLQKEDGTISLKVDEAEVYHDKSNPSSNTAEWNVVVSKSGRFNVWLSSSTKDTTSLKFKNKVMLNILDNRLEVQPECDKIIHNSGDVSLPYFRADSFLGALYIQDTGNFNIQLISEKIIPESSRKGEALKSDDSKLISVVLTPVSQ